MHCATLWLALLAFFASPAAAQVKDPDSVSTPAAGRAVDATAVNMSLIRSAIIVKDASGDKTVAQVIDEAGSVKSAMLDNEVFSTGFSSAAYWFVVHLENKQATPLKRLLIFEPSWLDDVRVTLIDAQGTTTQSFVGGDTHPFAQRSEPYHLINFDLTVPPGASALAVRVKTRGPFFLTLRLMSHDSFGNLAASEGLYYGLVYGGLLSLLIFNLVLSVSSREVAYFAYCGLLVSFLLMHATYNGHLFRWVFPRSPEVNTWAHSVLIYLYCFAGLMFALIFLDLEAKSPDAYLWTRRMLYAMGACFVVSALLGGYRAQVISSILWVCVFAVTAFTLAMLSLQRRNAAAILYLNGSVAGLVGSSLTALTVLGILNYSFWTFKAVDFGMLLDASLLSLALSARISQGRRLERLRRFFSPAVADQLLSATNDELYRPHHRNIVVLFLDLRGYTAFTQKHGADEVMRILGEFHAAMGELIHLYEATLERFAGDGMMIFLNDPVEIPEAALRGAKMALDMQARFAGLNKLWQERSYSLSMGIGIAEGMATIGAIGFEGRRDYAAIGNVTNLAARLCSEASAGQILISSVVAANIEKSLPVSTFGSLALKGFPEPVVCYELTPASGFRTSLVEAPQQCLS